MSMAQPASISARWAGPTTSLRRVATPVFYRGLPALSAPYSTSSYSLSFLGPAVQCQNMEADAVVANLSEAITPSNYKETYRMTEPFCSPPLVNCRLGKSFQYFSWTPGNLTVPFTNGSSTLGTLAELSSLGALSGVYGNLSDGPYKGSISPAALMIATRTSQMKWAVLNCSLYNASYEASFMLHGGTQSVNISKMDLLNGVGPDAGVATVGSPNPFAWSSRGLRAYFAVMGLLGEMLTGTIYEDNGDAMAMNLAENTLILDTVLAYTQEVFPIYANYTSDTYPRGGLPALPSLAFAIEQLVQNITIALFTDSSLLTTGSNVTTDVSVTRYEILYTYNWLRLAISYGIALALAFFALLVGFYTILSSGQSYSNNFSTILRVAQNEDLGALIDERDRQGQDPLPAHIARARFSVLSTNDRGQLRRRVGRDITPEHQALKSEDRSVREAL